MPSPESRRSVLVVDDDADLREALRDALGDEGYDVAEARDGSSALEYLRSHEKPSLILLDWNMAPMNGARFLAEMQGDAALAHVPVLVLTADGKAGEKARGGFVGRIEKPVDLMTLFEMIERHRA